MAEDQINLSPVRLEDRLEAMDNAINAWRKVTQKELLQQILSLGIADKIKLAKTVSHIRFRKTKAGKAYVEKEEFLSKSIGSRLRKDQIKEIEGVAFSFSRHGIYLEHGVGRGRPVGSSKAAAHKKAWLSVVLPPSIDDLADILEDEYADIAAAELRFNIPGVIRSKTSGG